MKHIIFQIAAAVSAIAASVLLGSCNETGQMFQNVSGSPGEIIVVIEGTEWDAEPGEIIRNTLEAEYQVLPQVEPKFKLYDVSPSNFTNLFWIHRNILIVNISPDVKENKTLITKDVWARPQTVVKVNAKDREAATELLKKGHFAY